MKQRQAPALIATMDMPHPQQIDNQLVTVKTTKGKCPAPDGRCVGTNSVGKRDKKYCRRNELFGLYSFLSETIPHEGYCTACDA